MTPPSRRRLATGLRLAEWFLVCVGVIALGWYTAARIGAAKDQASGARELERSIEAAAIRSAARGAGGGPQEAVGVVPASHARPAEGSLTGRIEVPRIRLSAIIREGVEDRTLDRAVGRVPETALPGERGNMALAAHRDTFFRPLQRIGIGDRIVVTTAHGRTEYVVRETRVVPPTEVSVLDPTDEWTLTLITCHPFNFVGPAPNRFIVRATAVEAAAGAATN
jgi:sortase A